MGPCLECCYKSSVESLCLAGIIVLSAIATDVGTLEHFPGMNLVKRSLVVSGPLWTGPLHNSPHLTEMMSLADQWGWFGDGEGKNLEKLLKQMIDESDPKLPVGYLNADEIASRAKLNLPPLSVIMNSLHEGGYAVSRSHIAPNAIKTDCPMVECVKIVKHLQQPAEMSSCH